MNILIILFLIIGFILLLKFMNSNKKNQLIEGLDSFNGRMAIDDQYFYDKLFNDVKYYPNLYKDDEFVEDGLVKCSSECPGNCVEYGQTGNSYCFPY